MVRSFEHHAYSAERLAAERRSSVTVVLPARECAPTIGHITRTLVSLVERGAIDEVLVVDADSADGTGDIARAEGARVVSENALMPQFGRTRGKGDAMWRALSVAQGEVVCYLDADSGGFGEHFACGVVGALLLEPRVEFVKGYFRRPFKGGGGFDGGRVTQLTARPLLRRFWPDLAVLHQPLAGEMAARRELLCSLPFSTGYAVETAMLLDIHAAVGTDAIAQVDLEVRENDHKALPVLAPMADEVLAAAMVRLEREGRLAPSDAAHPLERPPMASVLAAAA